MVAVLGAKAQVDAAMAEAVRRVAPAEQAAGDPLVRRSERADFQCDLALGLGRKTGRPPRELAASLLAALTCQDPVTGATGAAAVPAPLSAVELSGPGFLNLTVADPVLWSLVAARLCDERLGLALPAAGSRTVVDYSGPNIAKELHVGHIRSTVIGDSIVRILTELGVDVVRANHLGDWGTSFGRLIRYLVEHPELELGEGVELEALDELYKVSQTAFATDPAFADRARAAVVALQGGDEATLAVWRRLIDVSTAAFQVLYQRLGVLLTPEDADPESFYNPWLDEVVDELAAKGLLTESGGAQCVFLDGHTSAEGEPLPLIVRKSDGGYGYAATDLAAVRYRVERLAADRILYVIDARQALHLRMVFETARLAGWLPPHVETEHVVFGTILGTDGRPYRSRSGQTPRLRELLDLAVDGARTVVEEKSAGELPPEELDHVVQAAGIGAVKYADLSNARVKDYVFDPARMVSLTGNTSVYLQYAHARVCSVLRKLPPELVARSDADLVDTSAPIHPAERRLIFALDEFGAVLAESGRTLEPHRLCSYLYELARAFSVFWQTCPILKAEEPAVRGNRAALARLTGRTLTRGLHLLGIEAPERL